MLASPTLESPILSTNTSQFSTGSCLDYSFCQQQDNAAEVEQNSNSSKQETTYANTSSASKTNPPSSSHRKRVSTPQHLFHENVLLNDNSLDTLEQDLDLEAAMLDENNNSLLSNRSLEGRNLFAEHQQKGGGGVMGSPLKGANSPAAKPTARSSSSSKSRSANSSPASERHTSMRKHLPSASDNHPTFASSPIAKISTPSRFKSVSNPSLHTTSPPSVNRLSATYDDAPPVSPVIAREHSFSFQQKHQIHQSTNLMLSPLLSPTKSIQSTSMVHAPSTNAALSNQIDSNIVNYITNLFDQQRRINVMNMKLNCVNLFANFANILKTNSLQHHCRELSAEASQRRQDCEVLRYDVSQGKERIQDLETTIEENQTVIQSLNVSVQDLNQSVHDQSEKLEYASSAYNQSLRHLEKSLGYYKKILAQYESSKLRRDLAFDGSLFVACLYIVNTYVVNLPVHLLITLMRFQRRASAKWMQFFLKSCVMLLLFVGGRKFAIKYHMHSAMGSVSTYGAYLLQGAFESIASVTFLGGPKGGNAAGV
eukprot:CAMPEP_0117448600 /NCGR_PEP_ID=MMETSP0759-20121206/7490_1 /TAXON_ID=63605 /ORGANISM="Percolomonas cosmopolitus, Strain WS" /LENGTH=538 /DNA_ID=CAMNT_0005241003 /DNA_START=226 /DNA_END=1842 /DNA_ORIENTATION=+